MEDEARVAVGPLAHIRKLPDADVAVLRECLQAVAITGPKNDLNSVFAYPSLACVESCGNRSRIEMLDLVY